jgi:hypothetical protein
VLQKFVLKGAQLEKVGIFLCHPFDLRSCWSLSIDELGFIEVALIANRIPSLIGSKVDVTLIHESGPEVLWEQVRKSQIESIIFLFFVFFHNA